MRNPCFLPTRQGTRHGRPQSAPAGRTDPIRRATGVTPDQATQLAAAVTHDARLLQRLNDDAAADHLAGFALPAAGAAPNLVGTYDKASGVVTLPPGDFQPSGSAPGNDLIASLRVQDMTARYAHTTWVDAAGHTQPVSQNMIANLQDASERLAGPGRTGQTGCQHGRPRQQSAAGQPGHAAQPVPGHGRDRHDLRAGP